MSYGSITEQNCSANAFYLSLKSQYRANFACKLCRIAKLVVPTPRSNGCGVPWTYIAWPIESRARLKAPSMNRFYVSTVLGILSLSPFALRADTLNVLGVADAFSVLGATTVTNT